MSLNATPSNVPSRRLAIVSPVKDEAEFLERTIRSVASQTVRPRRWVIVNDGSKDATGAIADAAAREHDWIEVVHRRPGEGRRVGPGVIEAFYDGLERVNLQEHDYICKLDGDLELSPRYFEALFERFEADPALGTISGKPFLLIEGRLVAERTSDEFSLGAAKLYRRQCFEAIGGFVREVMWDGIDCHRCRMLGWKAESRDEPDLRILHLRQMGSSHRNIYHGRARWGRGQHFMGAHPLYMLGIVGYRMLERPWIAGGLCILWGYVESWAKRRPRYGDPEFRRHLHRWQLNELRRRLWRCVGLSAAASHSPAIAPSSAAKATAAGRDGSCLA